MCNPITTQPIDKGNELEHIAILNKRDANFITIPSSEDFSSSRTYPVENSDRYVHHAYHDHALETEDDVISEPSKKSFPLKLHDMLDKHENDERLRAVVSWRPHGRAFTVHKRKDFEEDFLMQNFRQHKFTSFQRQLNLYGFIRLTRGDDKGAYYHELFLRGKRFLCNAMSPTRVKGKGSRRRANHKEEPDFYSMPSAPAVEPLTSSQSPANDSVDEISSQEPHSSSCSTPIIELAGNEMIRVGDELYHYLDIFDRYFQLSKFRKRHLCQKMQTGICLQEEIQDQRKRSLSEIETHCTSSKVSPEEGMMPITQPPTRIVTPLDLVASSRPKKVLKQNGI